MGPDGGGGGGIGGACSGISGAGGTPGTGDARGALEGLVPLPRSVATGNGEFALTARTPIFVSDSATEELRAVGTYLAELLRRATGYSIPLANTSQRACFGAPAIELELDASIAETEGYRFEASVESLRIRGRTAHGVFHGIQTLRQILAPEIESPTAAPKARWLVPAVSIEDAPRFSYRGMHLDVSRHFFPPAFVKKYIDLLALYKLNTFHFHLTDDQGWRLEIEAYPRLTSVGAWRNEAGVRYGGFYTQAEVRDIVRYASERFVTIVPEIEMPGHSRAAVAAYPEYACTPGPFEVATTWGVFYDIFCPSDETFAFLEGVLREVFSLFPGNYVHLGGDEAPKDRWETSEVAQAVIDREGLANEEELQGYFMRRMETFAASYGKSIIGWDEILDGGVMPSAVIMAWRGADRGTLAARQGHDVIMTPTGSCYFDYYQGPEATEPEAFPGSYTPLREVYEMEPMPSGLDAQQATHVLGAQGNLWSEYIATPEHAEYMALPRAIALAEVLWSERDALDYSEFLRRLDAHSAHLDAQGTNYARLFRDDL
jgi:hexosaminidase